MASGRITCRLEQCIHFVNFSYWPCPPHWHNSEHLCLWLMSHQMAKSYDKTNVLWCLLLTLLIMLHIQYIGTWPRPNAHNLTLWHDVFLLDITFIHCCCLVITDILLCHCSTPTSLIHKCAGPQFIKQEKLYFVKSLDAALLLKLSLRGMFATLQKLVWANYTIFSDLEVKEKSNCNEIDTVMWWKFSSFFVQWYKRDCRHHK